MLCQNCGKKEANVRYTQIINGVKSEIALCSKCANKMGIDGFEMPDFHSILGDFFNDYAENSLLPSIQGTAVKCKECGTTYNDFINTGMFGCSECYDIFETPIDSLLKNLHGTYKHIGRGSKLQSKGIKVDKKLIKENDTLDRKEDLQKQLEKAIKEERYEDAAKIRDKINDEKNNS